MNATAIVLTRQIPEATVLGTFKRSESTQHLLSFLRGNWSGLSVNTASMPSVYR